MDFSDATLDDERVQEDSRKKEKKPRNPNFAKDETEPIFRETGKRARLLVDRHGPGVTEEKKKKFWDTLARNVTALNGNKYQRTASQVKKKWQTTRSSCKTKMRSNIHEINKTGGGNAVISKLTDAEELFIQNIPIAPENIHGIPGALETNIVTDKRKPKASSSNLYAEIGRCSKATSNPKAASSKPSTSPTSSTSSDGSILFQFVPETQLQIGADTPMATSSPRRTRSPIHGLIRNSLRVANSNSIDNDLNQSSTSTILDLDRLEVDNTNTAQSRHTDSLLELDLQEEQDDERDIFIVGRHLHHYDDDDHNRNNVDNNHDQVASPGSVFDDNFDDGVQQQTSPDSDDNLQRSPSPPARDQDAAESSRTTGRQNSFNQRVTADAGIYITILFISFL
jgi:hypothetical protein